MYQHVANRISYQNLQTLCRECFGLHVHFTELYLFKEDLARFYQPTYQRLLQTLMTGPMLNVDETHINLRKERAYAWVFADFDNVVFLFRPNRDGTFLAEMLDDFTGVLVSDFYAAYDSLKCEQQKCLVHLIRDINTDIRKNPFDEELKGLAGGLGGPLRDIVLTIDRYGLKKRFMRRHMQATVEFVDDLERTEFTSKCAVKYQKRILKYRNKLFAFLHHDGVPWNNNNAEHAIKHLARYRREVDGKVTQNGVTNYLVLLSLYLTCKYRGVNCLDFMLSGSRDLLEFCERGSVAPSSST